MVKTGLDGMGREIQGFTALAIRSGQELELAYIQPLKRGFDELSLAVFAYHERLTGVIGVTHEAAGAMLQLGAASSQMAEQTVRALADVRGAVESTALLIIAAARSEVDAINEVTAAYLRQAAAARLAGGSAGVTLAAGALPLPSLRAGPRPGAAARRQLPDLGFAW